MTRNGTVCQAGSSRIAARLSPTKITQMMSSADAWHQRRAPRAQRAADSRKYPGPGRCTVIGRSCKGPCSVDTGPSESGPGRSWPLQHIAISHDLPWLAGTEMVTATGHEAGDPPVVAGDESSRHGQEHFAGVIKAGPYRVAGIGELDVRLLPAGHRRSRCPSS